MAVSHFSYTFSFIETITIRSFVAYYETLQHLLLIISKSYSISCQPVVTPTGTPRQIDILWTWILRAYVKDGISANVDVISMYFFDVISLIEKSTSFPRTFFDVILMVEKSSLFPSTFLDVISMVKKSTLFPRTFFDVISMVEKSTLLPRAF